MTIYEGDFTYKVEEYGHLDGIDAVDVEEAEQMILEHVRNVFPEAMNIEVDNIRAVS